MIRRLLTSIRDAWIADDPNPQLSRLDRLDGLTPEQAFVRHYIRVQHPINEGKANA